MTNNNPHAIIPLSNRKEATPINAKRHYDIVIVGAGPAGANLTRLIDHRQRSVLLIDGSCGKRKPCGGLLSPDAQDILARYDISLPGDILVSPQLFSVRVIDLGNGACRYYRRSYMNVDRERLDCFFRSLVPEGVQRINGRCQNIRRTAEGFALTVAGEEITCTHLVGADGASSAVRRFLIPNDSSKRYLAIQQWYPAEQSNPFYSCLFDSETSTGCSWIFFKNDAVIFGGAFDIPDGRAAFEKQKQKLAAAGILSPTQLEHPLHTEACQLRRPTLSHGVLNGQTGAYLIGEAAGLISPSSFEGISYALASSEALADALNAKDDPQAVLRHYRRGTAALRRKIALRCLKRPFMYAPPLRRAVMASGIGTIRLKKGDHT